MPMKTSGRAAISVRIRSLRRLSSSRKRPRTSTQAHHCQAFHGELRDQTLGLHARAADADEFDLGMALAQGLHQAGAEDIPRRLARDQRDAQLAGCHGQRVMPRVELWMEPQNTATSGNCAADSASSVSASSTVRPWRYTTL